MAFRFSHKELIAICTRVNISTRPLAITGPPRNFHRVVLPFRVSLSVVVPFLCFHVLKVARRPLNYVCRLTQVSNVRRFLLLRQGTRGVSNLGPLFCFLFFALTFVCRREKLRGLLLLFFKRSQRVLRIVHFVLSNRFTYSRPTSKDSTLLPIGCFGSSIRDPIRVS